MTDLSTGNGHDAAGELRSPVTRPRDATGASRSRRYRDKRKAAVTATAPPPTVQPAQRPTKKPNDFKGSVTVERDAGLPANRDGEKGSITNAVTPFAQPRWAVADPASSRGERHRGTTAGRYLVATCLAAVGITLSAVGMVETASYSLAVGGVLFCVLAVSADLLTLTMPSVIGALWRRRSPAVVLAGLLWCAGAAVTVANLAGYVGEHIEQYQNGRQTMATGRTLALERLARLRDERKAIAETRPPAAIAAALNDARRSERPALREALALAKRRDALDIELVTFEQQLAGIPQVASADASAAVLSDISGTTVSEHELRRLRLALLLGLPLCGGLVLSLAFALTAAVRHSDQSASRTRFSPHTFDGCLNDAIEG
jgi:hypothetical protein